MERERAFLRLSQEFNREERESRDEKVDQTLLGEGLVGGKTFNFFSLSPFPSVVYELLKLYKLSKVILNISDIFFFKTIFYNKITF